MIPVLFFMMLTSSEVDYFDEWIDEKPRGCEILNNDEDNFIYPKIVKSFSYEFDDEFEGKLRVLHRAKKEQNHELALK